MIVASATPSETLYRRSADLGDPEGQYCLAALLRRRKDPHAHQEAALLLKRPAAVGMPRAQYLLGTCYETGDGVEKKPKYAVYMYQQAAQQGHAEAMVRLGICYETGSGVAQDPAVAANLYRQAAERGNGLALCRLGRLYERGTGVHRDLRQAADLYEKGKQANVPGAGAALARVRCIGLPSGRRGGGQKKSPPPPPGPAEGKKLKKQAPRPAFCCIYVISHPFAELPQTTGTDVAAPEGTHILGAVAENTAGTIFPQDNGIAVHIDLQRILFHDVHGAPQLHRQHDPAQLVHLSYNTRRFHNAIPPVSN